MKLSRGARALFSFLQQKANKDGVTWWGQDRLAKEIDYSLRSVKSFFKELSTAGMVEIDRRGGGKTNLYRLKYEVQKLHHGSAEIALPSIILNSKKRRDQHHCDDAALSTREEVARTAAGFSKLSAGDRAFLREVADVPESALRAAILLGRARSMTKGTTIHSMRYFAGTLEEVHKQPLEPGYIEHLERFIARHSVPARKPMQMDVAV